MAAEPPLAFGPRRNVLVFYGVGGIGKSSLLKKLSNWVEPPTKDATSVGISNQAGGWDHTEWGNAPGVSRPIITFHLDLEAGELDLEEAVLRLRTRLKAHKVPVPSFDLGLRSYWWKTQGTKPLREPAGPMAELVDESVGNLLASGIDLTIPGAAVLFRALRKLLGNASERRNHVRLTESCPDLGGFLTDLTNAGSVDRDDCVHLVNLLEWDLRQIGDESRPMIICFVDGYQRAAASPSDLRVDELMCTFAHDLPSALFVFAGRDRVRWNEPGRFDLREVCGPERWPTLVEGASEDPRQHLVGELSETDARRLLKSVHDESGTPILQDDVVDRIWGASGGIPLFLDSEIQRAIELQASGQTPEVADFAESRSKLVTRIIKELPPDEQRLLRHACILMRWNPSALATASDTEEGLVSHRFCRRAFVHESIDHHLGFRIHAVISDAVMAQRAALSNEESTWDHPWNHNDWSAAEDRCLEALRAELELVDDPVAQQQIMRNAVIITELGSTSPSDGWLMSALARSRFRLQVARSLPPAPEGASGYGHDLADFLRCVALPLPDQPNALAALQARPDISETVRLEARRNQAYRLRELGKYKEALAILQELVDAHDGDGDLHMQQLTQTLVGVGDIRLAWTQLKPMLDSKRPRARARAVANLADITRYRGLLAEAADLYEERIRWLMDKGDYRIASQQVRNRANSLAFLAGDHSASALDLVEPFRDDPNIRTRAGVLNVDMLIAAGDGDAVGRVRREQMRILSESELDPWAPARTAMYAFHFAVANDLRGIDTALDLYEQSWRDMPSPWQRVAELWRDELAGVESPNELGVNWLEPESDVRARWGKIIQRRRDLLSGGQS